MKRADIQVVQVFALLTLIISGCSDDFKIDPLPADVDLSGSIYYQISVEDSRESVDVFEVEAYLDGTTLTSDILQFAAAVPGTYGISDFGRYVTYLEVYDRNSKRIETEQISTNQWQIGNPEKAYYIKYGIEETWGNSKEGTSIYNMAGTTIATEYALLNLFGIIGYPLGAEEFRYMVSLDYPASWSIGTELALNADGHYTATSYHELVDSPVLLGDLKSDVFTAGGVEVGVYFYSRNDLVDTDILANDLRYVIEDAVAFLKTSAVDYYKFLFVFDTYNSGALEHTNSSVYVLRNSSNTDELFRKGVRFIAAHEFFHTITPLKVRSEQIDYFDYSGPEASEHLWLYEGVTEWASDLFLYRGGTLPLPDLMLELQTKYARYTGGNPTISLTEASALSFTDAGRQVFASVYYKGSLAAMVMDIYLLEWSEGTFGLRELMLELSEHYRPGIPFRDDDLFGVLTDLSYPQLADYLDTYIGGNADLPVAEALLKVGVENFEMIAEPDSAQQAMFQAWSQNL